MLEASELILTPSGRIYHLDLHPDELAPTVITVGDPGRVPEVSRYFDRLEHSAAHREFVTHTGYIGAKRISVVSTGIGTDNIDIVLNELDALANIDFASREAKPRPQPLNIIRLGTAGALQEDIPVDSLLVSSFGIGLDNLLHYYRFEPNAEESFILGDFRNHITAAAYNLQPYIAEGSVRLRNYFSEGFVHGITVTCPGFYAPQGRRLRLAPAHPSLMDILPEFRSGMHRIANMEMETSAFYGLGKLLGHHCLSVSTIINNRSTKAFTADLPAAVDHMIRRSLEIIAAL